ncbi:hypothetical protein LPTSP3_g30850 [Leptospira kobayashii]|uniref:Lipoprotein n=1 Tax=Leptospira kobayashii TaxID=1917830 RepID=A0ABM7UMK8_9LEPT|nr:hypothetical protein [Leptospira kobayashii]BDA80155.1 hypothetical protein LPTSP3_g30850 [Leptospira kobayashii]
MSFNEALIGPIGDMFGAINALFSGLALAGIIYTIYLQHEELKLQREELKLTRIELRRSAEAQEKSQLSIQEQADALTYTATLNTLSSLINSTMMQLEPSNGFYLGDTDKKIKLKNELTEYHQKLIKLKGMLEKENSEFFKE